MSIQNSTAGVPPVDTVDIDALQETDGPRMGQIDPNHVDQLSRSIKREGLVQAISVTSSDSDEYAYDVVDGRHRKRALEQIGVEEVLIYDMPGERSWAVPHNEATAEIGIQSMAANALQKQLTQAEKGRFLKHEIQEKVIEEMDSNDQAELNIHDGQSPANVRGQNTVPPARQILYHLDEIDGQKEEWKFADELYETLERIRFALDIGDPRTEAEYLQFYNESPDEVADAWQRQDIGKSAVEHLRQIEQADLREFALEKASQQRPNGYSVRDLEKVRKAVDYDIDRVNQKILSEAYSDIEAAVDEAKEISECESKQSEEEPENQTQEADELKHVPDNPSEEDLDRFKGQLEDAGDMEKVRTITDRRDMAEDAISKKCYEIDKNGGDYQQALEDELEKQEREIERNERVESYAFEKTPFDRGSQGDSMTHQDAPLAYDTDGRTLDAEDGFELDDAEVAVFFHDNLQMDLEIPNSLNDEDLDGFFHLLFFSPPYFDQSGTMPVKQWLPDGTSAITDEETLDATYENYLDWLSERIKLFTRKLKPGRALIINVSDTSTANLKELDEERYGSAPEKRYNIPADLSSRIRREVPGLKYDSTIQWMRRRTTSQRGGQYWSESTSAIKDGKQAYPLYYYPQDVTEELLIFRKGGNPDHEAVRSETASRFDVEFETVADFRNEVRFDGPTSPFEDCIDEATGEFDNYRNNVWKIAPDTDELAHDAGFPRELARLVIQMFSLPGERVGDPFGGYATTLREVQKINSDQESLPNRQGFAWENFSSEQIGQEDYRDHVDGVLSQFGLKGYRQPLRD